MSKTISLLDIAKNVGKDTVVLTKVKGEYRVFTETNSLLELSRELVTLYKNAGNTSEEIIKIFKI